MSDNGWGVEEAVAGPVSAELQIWAESAENYWNDYRILRLLKQLLLPPISLWELVRKRENDERKYIQPGALPGPAQRHQTLRIQA